MNVADQQQLTDLWHKNTCHLNEQIDDIFKLAQDQAYEIGLQRGREISAKTCLECKQLASIKAGRDAYLEGIAQAAAIADKTMAHLASPISPYNHGVLDAKQAIVTAIRAETGGDVSVLQESLQWAACRLYDTELITASRACELLGGIKAQEFRALYSVFMDGKGGIDDTVAETI